MLRSLNKKWLIINIIFGLILSFAIFLSWNWNNSSEKKTFNEKQLLNDLQKIDENLNAYTLRIYDNFSKIGELNGKEALDAWVLQGEIHENSFQIFYDPSKKGIAEVKLKEQNYEIPLKMLGIITLQDHIKLAEQIISEDKNWVVNEETQIIIPITVERLDQQLSDFYRTSFSYSNLPIQVSYVLCYDNLENGPTKLSMSLVSDQLLQKLEYSFKLKP